jgi:hypothetical protein
MKGPQPEAKPEMAAGKLNGFFGFHGFSDVDFLPGIDIC